LVQEIVPHCNRQKQICASVHGAMASLKRRSSLIGAMATKNKRLLLLSDMLPYPEGLIKASWEHVVVVPVQYKSWSIGDILKNIADRAGPAKNQFESVAILDHGASWEVSLLEVADGTVPVVELGNTKEMQHFLKTLASYTMKPGDGKEHRVDLLSCNIGAGTSGEKVLEKLESMTQVPWRAKPLIGKDDADEDGGEDPFHWVKTPEEHKGCATADYFDLNALKLWEQIALHGVGPQVPEQDKNQRILLVSDRLDESEIIIKATKDDVLIVPVKFDSWSLHDLLQHVVNRAGLPQKQYESVGLIDHGAPGEFSLLASVANGKVTLEDIKESKVITDFLIHMSKYVMEPTEKGNWKHDPKRRVDLLGCCVADGSKGQALLDYLEDLTEVNWCASKNNTGAGKDAENGFDWIMESDPNVGDVAGDYFIVEKIKRWEHTAVWGFVSSVVDSTVRTVETGVRGVGNAAHGAGRMAGGAVTGNMREVERGFYQAGDGACDGMALLSGPQAIVMGAAIEQAIQEAINALPAGKKQARQAKELRDLMNKVKAAKSGNPKAMWQLLRQVQQKGIRVPGF